MNYYTTDYYNTTTTAAAAGLGAAFVVYMIICIAIAAVMIVSLWKVFTKAGRPGWAAIVPFYNMWTLFEIGGQKGAYIFFIFIPFVGSIIYLVFEIKALLEIAKRFGKDTTFGVLSIFFPFVTFPILAFSDAKYTE